MKYAIETKREDGTWARYGGETFEFMTNAELRAISLQENFQMPTRVVSIEEPIIHLERWL